LKILKGADLKIIRLNNKQCCWVRDYLRTSKDYDPDDPFIILLRALLERPEITMITMRMDQPIIWLMIDEIGE